jgi:hypothetical protein
VLINIKRMVQLIYEFKTDAPLFKFLAAAEMVLLKCHDWENVAARDVSLAEHLNSPNYPLAQTRAGFVERALGG